MKHTVTAQIRDGGYEILYFVGGFLALSVRPTFREWERIEDWIEKSRCRRACLSRLQERGLVEAADRDVGGVLRLTELGHAALNGGREPVHEWARPWDGRWRLLAFDLPRDSRAERARFGRWLRGNHVGQLQGSVWVTPHPVPAIEAAMTEAGLDPRTLMIFAGETNGDHSPREIAANAWAFSSINTAYRTYQSFARRTLTAAQRKAPPPHRLEEIIRQDRAHWWEAVRRDPLLPEALHPNGYQGPLAYELRRKLHETLIRAIDLDGLP